MNTRLAEVGRIRHANQGAGDVSSASPAAGGTDHPHQEPCPGGSEPSGAAASPGAGPARRVPLANVLLFFGLAVVGATADLWSKAVAFERLGLPGQSDVYWVIDGYFGIETAVNPGAVFGLGAGRGTFFAAMSVGAALGIGVWMFVFGAARSRRLTVALGCVTGGIIGNLYDRLGLWWQPGYDPRWKSGVRDWILWQANDQWKWPNFNIADSLLVVGACMLMYLSFFHPDAMGGEHDG